MESSGAWKSNDTSIGPQRPIALANEISAAEVASQRMEILTRFPAEIVTR